MPSKNHSLVQANLLGLWFQNANYRVHSEQNILLGGKKYVPDLCVYPRTLMDIKHDVINMTDAPLLIVEVSSPSQGWQQVQENVDAYLAAGVPSVWIVMPPMGAITVRNADGTQTTHVEGTVRDPGTGLEVNLADVFS